MLAGVLLHQVKAAGPVDGALHRLPRLQRPGGAVPDDALAVDAHGQHALAAQKAQVAGLATALRVKGGLVQRGLKTAGLVFVGAAGGHGGGKFALVRVGFVQAAGGQHGGGLLSWGWGYWYYSTNPPPAHTPAGGPPARFLERTVENPGAFRYN